MNTHLPPEIIYKILTYCEPYLIKCIFGWGLFKRNVKRRISECVHRKYNPEWFYVVLQHGLCCDLGYNLSVSVIAKSKTIRDAHNIIHILGPEDFSIQIYKKYRFGFFMDEDTNSMGDEITALWSFPHISDRLSFSELTNHTKGIAVDTGAYTWMV